MTDTPAKDGENRIYETTAKFKESMMLHGRPPAGTADTFKVPPPANFASQEALLDVPFVRRHMTNDSFLGFFVDGDSRRHLMALYKQGNLPVGTAEKPISGVPTLDELQQQLAQSTPAQPSNAPSPTPQAPQSGPAAETAPAA